MEIAHKILYGVYKQRHSPQARRYGVQTTEWTRQPDDLATRVRRRWEAHARSRAAAQHRMDTARSPPRCPLLGAAQPIRSAGREVGGRAASPRCPPRETLPRPKVN
ncbi:hypothetical protein BS78_06G268000 [Paspalum vaginatum]|nr:hypothetical protein BS78_06G268000 [Paspalum vaginatum]